MAPAGRLTNGMMPHRTRGVRIPPGTAELTQLTSFLVVAVVVAVAVAVPLVSTAPIPQTAFWVAAKLDIITNLVPGLWAQKLMVALPT